MDDFVIQRTGLVVHVLNASSPAAMAGLAIGERVAAEVFAAAFAHGGHANHRAGARKSARTTASTRPPFG